jgi:hypothetical protein
VFGPIRAIIAPSLFAAIFPGPEVRSFYSAGVNTVAPP